MSRQKITVAYGDGIGPEIMSATLDILAAADAKLDYDVIDIGEKVYQSGQASGMDEKAWKTLRENNVFLKAPITTPQGGGYRSLNVTIRKTLGLYANVRPFRSYHPFVATKHPVMDVIIVRENEEDLYAGIEHRQSHEVVQCLKLISRPGCERIIRYAFELAKQQGRKKVTCFSKDNIMKMTDGLFHRVFDEIGAEYPDLTKDHWIVDIGAARLANTPEMFDVIVMENLYGDILSDVAAEITGSVGLAGSANIGDNFAMFEAIHGSAPTIAGQGIANPSGLLLGAVQMLVHLGQGVVAENIHNAWLKTLEDGLHTGDIYKEGVSSKRVNTQEFKAAVIARLGQKPASFSEVSYQDAKPMKIRYDAERTKDKSVKKLVGVDVFFECEDRNPQTLAKIVLELTDHSSYELELITNRGAKVWPSDMQETFCTDHWRCRFLLKESANFEPVWSLIRVFEDAKLDVIKIENLYTFNGQRGYSLDAG